MDWEQSYQDQHTPWEKGEAAPPLLEWIRSHPDQITGQVLVPGCGLGHDCRALASLTSASAIIGIDIAPSAVDAANEFATVGHETYKLADLFDPDWNDARTFDWGWEHTCFCAINPEMRDRYVDAMHRVIRPGGHLLGVFFLDPYDDDHRPGGGPPHGTSLAELKARFEGSGKFRELDSYSPNHSYPGREGLERVILYTRVS